MATPSDRAVWDTLLDAARRVHRAHPVLSGFCAFPTDLTAQPVTRTRLPAADLFATETGLYSDQFAELRDAFVAAGSLANWQEAYRDTDIGQDFRQRFGYYCLIGENGAFASDQMRAWVVYMPVHLWYTWHHHPAEEIYLTVAGEAEFMRQGAPDVVLRPGETSAHASNQPHAMQTHDHPVMAYVIWRDKFGGPLVLSQH